MTFLAGSSGVGLRGTSQREGKGQNGPQELRVLRRSTSQRPCNAPPQKVARTSRKFQPVIAPEKDHLSLRSGQKRRRRRSTRRKRDRDSNLDHTSKKGGARKSVGNKITTERDMTEGKACKIISKERLGAARAVEYG